MKDNHLKFIFVGILLIAALFGRADKVNTKIAGVGKKIEIPQPVLLAQLKPIISQTFLPEIRPAGPIKDNSIPGPKLNAKAVLARDLDAGADLYSSNADLLWPLASLTKLMAAVIAVEDVGLNKETDISESVIATEGIAGNIEAGEKYQIGELVKIMLLVSSNRAASAVAEFYGKENFVKQMQSKAYFLEMNQTFFSDPTGLSSFNKGTAGDLIKLVNYILEKHPGLFKITAQGKLKIFEESRGSEKELLNINEYAAFPHPDFLGGKTGFTDEAGGNLISIFEYHGHKILLIVLGTDDRFGQTDVLFNWIKKAYNYN